MSADLGDRPKPKPFDELQNLYDVLEHVRQRPGMFVRNGSLDELGLLLSGYGLALRIHGVDERFDLDPVGPFAPVVELDARVVDGLRLGDGHRAELRGRAATGGVLPTAGRMAGEPRGCVERAGWGLRRRAAPTRSRGE